MLTEPDRTHADSPEPPALALAVLGLLAACAYHLCGVVSVLLFRLAEVPERLARIGEMGF